MKVIMIAVSSVDGKATRGYDPNIYKWTSKEDSDFYFGLLARSKLIVMGSGTFEAARHLIKHKKGRLRIVLTHNLKKYSAEQLPGLLEFTPETPRALVGRLWKKYNELLLVGGPALYSSFLKDGVVDEIYLTIEPLIFGTGKPLFEPIGFNEIRLKLTSVKKLNKKGTLLLKYKVEK